MEVEEHFVFNCTSLIATILGISTAVIVIICRLRLRLPVKVNCWFCNENTKIWRSEIDWWRCPSCEQYNGFSEDGDYNYDIAEQRYKSLNDSSNYATPYKSRGSSFRSTRSLCKNCNYKEETKVLQMSLIDPTKWSDDEIECYRESLEKQYPLCQSCDSMIKRILEKQTLWLIQYKMMLFKQRPINYLVRNTNIILLMRLTEIVLTILSTAIIYQPKLQTLPIIGASLQFSILVMDRKEQYVMHSSFIALWLIQCILLPYHDKSLYHFDSMNEWSALRIERISGYHLMTIISIILGLINLIIFNNSSHSTVKTANNLSFKKLSNRKSVTDTSLKADREGNKPEPSIPPTSTSSPVVLHNQSSDLASSTSQIYPIQVNGAPSLNLSLDESLRTLSSLSLSRTHSTGSPRNPKIFQTKRYGAARKNLNLFRKTLPTVECKSKFVLSPPKLKSEITQNSWVAGGYWQLGMDKPSLSRSSSQSSGFGSTGSNFPPSREPSVTNDVDRASIMSDTTMSHHATYNRSPCYNCHLNEQKSIKSVENQPTTIFSNTAWIAGLLCGSLIFNIIIFCTILLYR